MSQSNQSKRENINNEVKIEDESIKAEEQEQIYDNPENLNIFHLPLMIPFQPLPFPPVKEE